MFQLIKRFDVRASVTYGVIATLWIISSDFIVLLLFGNNHPFAAVISLLKGFGFVIVTTIALYAMLSTELRTRSRIEHQLQYERDMSPVGIAIVNLQGEITYVNNEVERILNQPRSRLIGLAYSKIFLDSTDVDGNLLPVQAPALPLALPLNQPLTGLQRTISTPDGKRGVIEINVAPLFDEGKTLSGFIASFSDVTLKHTHEKIVRESEVSLKRAQAIAHLGDWTWNTQTNTVRWSDEMYNIFGVDRAVFTGDLSTIIDSSIHPDDREAVKQSNDAVINEQKLVAMEYRVVWQDGSVHHVWAESGETITDADGKILYLSGIVQDITERKRAEAELRLKSAALDSAANGIVITNISGIIEWVNPAFSTLTGYTPEEAQGHNQRDLVRSGQQNPAFYKDLWMTITDGQVWHGELINRRKDGTIYTEEQTITPLRDASGQITHFIGIKQDITERKRAEAAILKLNEELEARVVERTTQLNHIKERIESILNSNADPIIFSRSDGLIEQVNPAFTRIFGYQSDDVRLQPITKLASDQNAPQLEQVLASVIKSRQVEHIDISVLRQDGSLFDASLMLSPVIENPDRLMGVVCSVRDITNSNHMLRHAMDLSELKSRYVSMAAHDLRNPMAVILTSSDTLEHYYDRMNDEKKKSKYEQIHRSIRVMTDILDDVLIMGQVDSGKLEFLPAPMDVVDFCQTMVAEALQSSASVVNIDFEAQDITEPVAMDAKLLRHILSNLLSNAIKYSLDNSRVLFKVGYVNSQIVFRIQDHGIGIPEADQARLFETFYRASNATHIRGTGLGLVIVKEAIELHKGTIEYKTEVGQGTTFIVTLPCHMMHPLKMV